MGLALLLGSLAAVTDRSPRPPSSHAPVVTAVELARWVKDRRDGLRVVDLRGPSAEEGWRVPGSLILARPSARDFVPGDRVVLVTDDGDRAGRVARELRASGIDAHGLAGGASAWVEEILSPVVSSDASPEERRRFDEIAELCRYFGGLPRVLSPTEAAAAARASAGTRSAALRRRGCGF
jgi:rhodanese-related sulfurtransferase